MKFVILKKYNLIIQGFKGTLTYDKWLISAEAIWKHPEYDNSYRGIIDFRGADIQMGISEIKSIVELLSQDDNSLRADAIILIDKPGAGAFASIFSASIEELLHTRIATTEEGVARKFDLDVSVFEELEGPDTVTLSLD